MKDSGILTSSGTEVISLPSDEEVLAALKCHFNVGSVEDTFRLAYQWYHGPDRAIKWSRLHLKSYTEGSIPLGDLDFIYYAYRRLICGDPNPCARG